MGLIPNERPYFETAHQFVVLEVLFSVDFLCFEEELFEVSRPGLGLNLAQSMIFQVLGEFSYGVVVAGNSIQVHGDHLEVVSMNQRTQLIAIDLLLNSRRIAIVELVFGQVQGMSQFLQCFAAKGIPDETSIVFQGRINPFDCRQRLFVEMQTEIGDDQITPLVYLQILFPSDLVWDLGVGKMLLENRLIEGEELWTVGKVGEILDFGGFFLTEIGQENIGEKPEVIDVFVVQEERVDVMTQVGGGNVDLLDGTEGVGPEIPEQELEVSSDFVETDQGESFVHCKRGLKIN